MRRLAIIGILLLLVSCGGGSRDQLSVVGLQSSDGGGGLQAANEPASQSLGEALAELDVLQTPEGVDAQIFQQLKDELAALLTAKSQQSATGRFVSQAPCGDCNKPADLTLVDVGESEYLLLWHEVNVGDYDNSGSVGIADITPIAMHFGEDASDPNSTTGLIDGSGNQTVDISDITGIAMNFGCGLAGYNVDVEGALQPNQGEPGDLSVMRPAEPDSERVSYSYSLTLGGLVNVTVRPADSGGAEGVESDPAELGTGDAPAAPQNLNASASEAIGAGRIMLTWTVNTEEDLAAYWLYRTDGIVAYEQVATITSTTFPLMYTDDKDEELLDAGLKYTYYLTAVDEDEFESTPSNEAATTPFFPAAPAAPTALDASDETDPYGLCIAIDWVASESSYLKGYEVFCKADGEAEFTAVATVGSGGTSFMDSGLEEGVTYTYCVQAYDTFEQRSDFSNEDSSVCSPYVAVEILSVSTLQTTYGFGETAQLTADVTNPAATITWSANAGSFPNGNQGRKVYWVPPFSACKVSFGVDADDGMTSDSDNSLEVVSTTMSNNGPAIGFSLSSRQSVTFSTYLGNHCVILLSFDDYC